MFKKLLIVGCGSTSMRIWQTCRKLGIKTVLAHSQGEADSQLVQLADEAFCIGRAQTTGRCPLAFPGLFTAARLSGADALHPGTGPLASSRLLAEICADHGLTWIGPDPEALALLEDRTALRRRMHDAGLPLVPGALHSLRFFKEAQDLIQEIGYPIFLQASSKPDEGEGRVVWDRGELEQAFLHCVQVARQRHGKSVVVLEKHLEGARQLQVQLLCPSRSMTPPFCGQDGQVTFLAEKECCGEGKQLDRTEAPPQGLTASQLGRLRLLAQQATETVGVNGLCTVTFLMDTRGSLYLQNLTVGLSTEHTVTEQATGIDLVHEQLALAAGERSLLCPGNRSSESRVDSTGTNNRGIPTPLSYRRHALTARKQAAGSGFLAQLSV